MMGNTVVIDHFGDDFRSQLTEICKIFRLRRAILKNVEFPPPLLENRENQGGGETQGGGKTQRYQLMTRISTT